MSEAASTAPNGVVTEPSAQQPTVTTAPATVTSPTSDPDWLNGRIAQAKRSADTEMLKALGVTSLDEAKAAIDVAKKAADANKSAEQRNVELQQQLAAEKERAEAYEATIRARATVELGTLTPEQRKAVEALAGDDVASQLLAIDTLRPTWAGAAAPAAPAASLPPKDTAPAPAAPKDGAPSPPPDAKAIYEELKKTNPILASRYALSNGVFETK